MMLIRGGRITTNMWKRSLTTTPPPHDYELDEFNKEVKKVSSWWKQSRWHNVKRNYTAESVVKLRGTIPQERIPSMADKLYDLFQLLKLEFKSTSTFDAFDSVQINQMCKYLSTIYVSGSTMNGHGPDFADYPMDTVPNKVKQLFQAQLFHDRKQRQFRLNLSSEERSANPSTVDYMRPILADANSGHGGINAVMKLTKLFIQSGAAGIHIEDQKHGTKKGGHMGGKVLVSTQEHVDRLQAARLQADIMSNNLLIIARTDGETASLLDTNIDGRDQWQILGTCNRSLGNERDYVAKKVKQGDLTAHEAHLKWMKAADLCTLSQAVERELISNGFLDEAKAWQSKSQFLSHRDLVQLIVDSFPMASKTAYPEGSDESALEAWCDDKARTREGYFRTLPGIDVCIQRGLAYSPYADLLWMETSQPCLKQAEKFSRAIRSEHPHQLLAYNLSPCFKWDQMTDDEIGNFTVELGKLGFVWQFISCGGFHVNALATDQFAKEFSKRGIKAYVENIQRKEREFGVETLKQQQWSGTALMDAQVETLDRFSSITAMGEGAIQEEEYIITECDVKRGVKEKDVSQEGGDI